MVFVQENIKKKTIFLYDLNLKKNLWQKELVKSENSTGFETQSNDSCLWSNGHCVSEHYEFFFVLWIVDRLNDKK